MLLAIDVGNTNTVFGLFVGDTLRQRWRMATRRHSQADDLGAFVLRMLAEGGMTTGQIEHVAICSVVPPVTSALRQMSERYFGFAAFVVLSGINTPLAISYDNPLLLGADRAVNSVAALHYYGGPAIVADFGTATKFEAINSRGEYLGGAIAPGLNIAAEALFAGSALLYRIDLQTPTAEAIGRDTTTAIISGVRLGYLAMVEGMVGRFRAELAAREPDLDPASIRVIATGGLARVVAGESSTTLNVIDPDLTLNGIRLVYAANHATLSAS